MSLMKRASVLVFSFMLLFSSTAFAAKKGKATPTPAPPQVPEEVLSELPQTIIDLLDLARSELEEVSGKELKKKNKYTKWRNNYEYGWCGGFVTWCMLELGIPQQEKNKTEKKEVSGLVHVKEAGVGKLYDGYLRMNRVTSVPQKGFIAVFGNANKKYVKAGATPYYHVGLVYDLQLLENGKYRMTTIEGNVSLNFTDAEGKRTKSPHTVRMYTRDFDPNAENPKANISLVPEEDRDREESLTFSWDYTYSNPSMYVTCFLMPWVPGDPTLDLRPVQTPVPTPAPEADPV